MMRCSSVLFISVGHEISRANPVNERERGRRDGLSCLFCVLWSGGSGLEVAAEDRFEAFDGFAAGVVDAEPVDELAFDSLAAAAVAGDPTAEREVDRPGADLAVRARRNAVV